MVLNRRIYEPREDITKANIQNESLRLIGRTGEGADSTSRLKVSNTLQHGKDIFSTDNKTASGFAVKRNKTKL